MKVAGITEAKNQLSALIDRVRHGDTVLIVDRGRPVARLESVVTDAADARDGRLARLERQGTLRRALDPPARDIVASAPPKARAGGSVLRILLEDRRQGR
jgi:prevent-host-death family protein